MTSFNLGDKIANLQNTLNTSLVSVLSQEGRGEIVDAIATKQSAKSKSTVLPISLPVRKFSKQNGESLINSPIDVKDYIVTADSAFSSFEIKVDDLMDQQESEVIDLYQVQVNDLLLRARQYSNDALVSYLESNPTTFTGEALFADSQTWGVSATAQDNNLGLSLTADNLKTAISTIRGYKDHLGQVIGLRGNPLTIVVPPALEYTAKELVAKTVSAGGVNVLEGVANVVVGDTLSSNYWYLVAGKPFIVLERQAPEVKLIMTNNEERVLVKGKVRMGVGVGSWAQIIRSTV